MSGITFIKRNLWGGESLRVAVAEHASGFKVSCSGVRAN